MMFKTTSVIRSVVVAAGLSLLPAICSCSAPDGTTGMRRNADGKRPGAGRRGGEPLRIRRVICVFDQKPWLNLDVAGDRDPEGIRFRVFLDAGTGKGILADGTFHVEMYKIDRIAPNELQRTLICDWHYPTSAVHTIAKPGWLGEGYFMHLRWHDKEVAGREIEMITLFEAPDGNVARSATKRLRVPKYST